MKAKNLLIMKIIYLLCVCLIQKGMKPAYADTVKSLNLPVVETLYAKSSSSDIRLHWKIKNADAAQSIQLYRKAYALPVRHHGYDKNKSVDKGRPVASISARETEYTDSKVQPGYYYYYRLKLVDEKHPQGKFSSAAIAVLKDVQPPEVPVLKSIKAADNKRIVISWRPSPSKDVVAYRIYRASLKGKPKVIHIENMDSLSNHDMSVTLKHTGHVEFEYRYGIAAVDASGNVSAKTPFKYFRMPDKIPPRSPSLVKATQKDGQVILQWLANRENDLDGYRVYRRQDRPLSSFALLNQKHLKQNRFIDDTVQPLQAYIYRVSAVDTFGNESEQTRGVLLRIKSFSQAHDAPNLMPLKNNMGHPVLHWSVVDKNAVSGFIVQRSDGENFTAISPLLQDDSFTDKSINRNMAYRYRIQALDKQGNILATSNIRLFPGGKK